MKHKKIVNKKNVLIIIVLTVLILSFLLLKIFRINISLEETAPIRSEELDLTIQVPAKYKVTQKFHTLSIKNTNNEITVSRYGSYYDNLADHIKDLSNKNNVQIDVLEIIPSEDYQIYKVKFNRENITNPQDISYLILTKDYTIYTFQASSEELYPDLDAIAQSFRYNP